jgi:hypothetical protein
VAQRPDSVSPPHRAWGAALDWIEAHDLPLTLGGIALIVSAAILVVATFESPEPNTTVSNPPSIGEEFVRGPVEYENRVQGFGFTYPRTWDLREGARFTRIQSPNGHIVASYRLWESGDLDVASSRLLDSIADAHPRLELIGMTRERIAGSRSIIVSGTATNEAGRPVRFLAITIRGEPLNYAISIFVPRRSDPARVLPRIESIVSSFELLQDV